MNKNIVKVKDVSVVFEGQSKPTVALENVNLTINDNDFVVLLGPSGCGKTSLLNLVAGYHQPTTGEVLMHDEPIKEPSKERGVVFQSTNLYPWLNVKENIEYGLKIRNVAKETRNELSALFLEEIDLSAYANHYPFELSGGMQQRVALIRALINNPEILLMDEPFGALDAMTRTNMQNLLRDLWHKGDRTFFLITHDIDEALSLGTRVMVMSKNPGQIIKEYKVDFHEKIHEDDNYVATLDEKFIEIKNEILNLIA